MCRNALLAIEVEVEVRMNDDRMKLG